jgi:predicted RNase H-like HicB family nuclease
LFIKKNDLYTAECPEVGTISQWRTIEAAIANLKETTELYLEEFLLGKVSKPTITTFGTTVNV